MKDKKVLIYIIATKDKKRFEYNKYHKVKYNQSISKLISDILIHNKIKWYQVKEIDVRS